MTNALILDCERRLGGVLREILAGLSNGVSLVTEVDEASRRVETGLYDLMVVAGVSGAVAADIAELVEEKAPGLPIVLVRGLVESGSPVPIGAFVAVLDEPFSARRFRDVTLAVLAAPELVRRRSGRRREVNWPAHVTRLGGGSERRLAARISNISPGGMMLEVQAIDLTHLHLSDEDGVQVTAGHPDMPLAARARVAYVDRAGQGLLTVGLSFVELEGEQANRLSAWFATSSAR